MGKNVLASFKFFSEVAPETLEMIAQKTEMLEFGPDDVIFKFDEPAKHLYGLLEGEVDLSIVFTDKVLKTEIEYEESIQASMVDEEKSIVIDTVAPNQIFGWASLVGPARRTVTAGCTENCKVVKKLSDIIAKRLKVRTGKLIETWVEAFDGDVI
jgi:CRP-like cAMP-binding protein